MTMIDGQIHCFQRNYNSIKMECPEISKEELMKIGWDHCKKLEKVINANNKVTDLVH